MLIKIRSKIEHPDFRMHLRYTTLIALLSNNLKITSTIIPKLCGSNGKKLLSDKINLLRLTKKSIEQDYEMVNSNSNYAFIAILWLPIKSYYLIHHLLCLLIYIITGQKLSLIKSHKKSLEFFTKKIGSSEIVFSHPLLNKTFDEGILNFGTKRGINLKLDTPDDIIYQLLMKKVVKDKIDAYKNTLGPSKKYSKNRKIIDKFKKEIDVSIFDFFYMMRIKMNYGDASFINYTSLIDAKLYFERYYELTINFYNCLFNWMKELAKNCPKTTI